ncbi:MAG: SDR family NAD(P)-dependent oxidoreductase [Candidatus Woesearchaeota archaeon]
MNEKICVITGATSGIGKVTALELAKQGYTIHYVARNEKKADQLLLELRDLSENKHRYYLCDLADMKQIRKVITQIKKNCTHINLLINNAGFIAKTEPIMNDQHIETTFAVNHLAPFLFTIKLFALLRKSAHAKVITVASSAYKMAHVKKADIENVHHYNPLTNYANSKLYNILFTESLAKKLKNYNIHAYSVHPGVVATNFAKESSGWFARLFSFLRPLLLTPEKGAKTTLYVATNHITQPSGTYFVKSKPRRVKSRYNTSDMEDALWNYSVQVTGEDLVTSSK